MQNCVKEDDLLKPCVRCRRAIEKAIAIEFTQIDQARKKKGLEHSEKKLTNALMKEIV